MQSQIKKHLRIKLKNIKITQSIHNNILISTRATEEHNSCSRRKYNLENNLQIISDMAKKSE
jgi:hypothetical protein